jgi:hypothetical protein
MKLPRWLVIMMMLVSVLSVLGAAAWLWITWPERTAREFVSLTARGEFEQLRTLLDASSGLAVENGELCLNVEDWFLRGSINPGEELREFMQRVVISQLQPNQIADTVLARGVFFISVDHGSGTWLRFQPEPEYQITVERGRITSFEPVGF